MSYLVNPHRFSGGGTPFWTNVVLQIQPNDTDGSTTFIDEKNGRTITAVGNAQINNNEILLDGAGDYLTLANHADWDLGAAFTLDVWATFESLTTVQCLLSQYNATTGNRGYSINWDGAASPKEFSCSIWQIPSNSGSVLTVTVDWAPADTVTRYAIRIERDAADTLRVFVDGVMVGSTVQSNNSSANALLLIGAAVETSPSSFVTGRIKALRLTKAARHGSDANYTVETLPLTTS